jgi:succinate-semialdehyde dehydrogenase/glutarate-semialdehyde dehydrogenase
MASTAMFKNLGYIDGAWVKAISGKTFKVKNPTTGEVIASVPDMDDKDTMKAVEAAGKVIDQHIFTF